MPSPSPELVALAGPNGAGKSTVGPALLRESLGISIFVNADVIAQGLSGLEPEGAAFEAGRIMLERLDELARRRASFAFETTLSGRAYARRISHLLQDGYRFHVVFRLIATGKGMVKREVFDPTAWSLIAGGSPDAT